MPTEETPTQKANEAAEELINKHASSAAEDRAAQWKTVVKAELRELIENASALHQKITEAKTAYKKQFYDKKFQKVSIEIKRMVAVLNRLEENYKEKQKEQEEK